MVELAAGTKVRVRLGGLRAGVMLKEGPQGPPGPSVTAGAGLVETDGEFDVDFGGTADTVASGDRGLPLGGEPGQMLVRGPGDDYDSGWVDPPEGGGVGGGTPLARTVITSGSYATTSTTPVDVNAAWSVTFVAPASGKVDVRAEAYSTGSTGVSYLCLRQGSTTISTVRVCFNDTVTQRRCVHFYVDGLTPGTTYTWKLGYYVSAGTFTWGFIDQGACALEVLAA